MSMEQDRTVQAISRILNARSVAIIGVSSDPRKFGFMTLDSIVRGGYQGQIYPINPKGGELLGLKVYKSYDELPDIPDLAVVIVPAKNVPETLLEVSRKGTPGAVILSSGFREVGRVDLEMEIASISERSGLRFVGPNVQGINYLPNKLCAMFFPVITKKGPLAVITQSGSATAALSEWAEDEGLGISAAINLGNQADLCESDYITFFATDEHTKAIALYIEGLKDGPRFLETIYRVAAIKPIVILKSGRSVSGQKAVSSHTGSLAGTHEVFISACHQLGVITADTIESLYDCAKALATMKCPKGNRILSISTSGGMGALAADEAEKEGLELAPLKEEFIKALRELQISPFVNMSNPLDLGYVTANDFKKVAMLADQFDIADLILLNLGDPVPEMPEVARFLQSNMQATIAVSYIGGGGEEKSGRVEMLENRIPVFRSPERAIKGIGAVVRYAQYRQQTQKLLGRKFIPKRGSTDNARLGGKFILEPDAIKILNQYGISYPPHGMASTATQAKEIADGIGYPVVLKVVSADVLHKTDVGGVLMGLRSDDEVKNGFEKIVDTVQSTHPTSEG